MVQKRLGFTLAEVIIVLGIVGVLAEMTIPVLVQNVQKQQTVMALKKAYSTLSSAFNLAVQENGTPDYWGAVSDSGEGSKALLDRFAAYMNITKNCGINAGCFPSTSYKTLDGGYDDYRNLNTNAFSHLQLSDGSLVMLDIYSSAFNPIITEGTVIASVVVDVNGFKAPNQFGKDTFIFYIFRNKLLPGGRGYLLFPENCSRTGSTQSNGRGCTAWVIYNENMDYLHCDDLSWTAKHKCS